MTEPSTGAEATFVPPPYPYERLGRYRAMAEAHEGGIVDLSVGTPCDPPPLAVTEALSASGSERSYPPSLGTPELRQTVAAWLLRRLGVGVSARAVAACVGTKEFVATLPQWLRLRSPSRDTVLYPAVSYPTYEMGAVLAGCRPVAVPFDAHWRMDLDAIYPTDADRALCLWLNSPGNPAGNLDDLGAAARWGRDHGVPVFSDECYVEFTWDGARRTILEHGVEGVIALHSLSKRSNAAGLRVGWYVGDPELVEYLSEVRKHVGMMVPGPVQAAAVVALDDDEHVDAQARRYLERLEQFRKILSRVGVESSMPGGGFYLWVTAPESSPVDGDAWRFAEWLAAEGGCLVSPGEFYGSNDQARACVRIALVQPMERLGLVGERLNASGVRLA